MIFVLAGWLGDRAEAGLDPPPATDVDAWVVLTGDPRPSGPVGVRASARWGSHRVSLSAHGPVAGRLDDALAGEQVHVIGSFRPGRPDAWTRWRHEVGTIIVIEVQVTFPGHCSPTAQMLCADCCRTVSNRLIETIGPFFRGRRRRPGASAVVADDALQVG